MGLCFRLTMQLMSEEFKHILSYYRTAIDEDKPMSRNQIRNKSYGHRQFISEQN